jgi:hypothetical protein
MTDAHTTPPGEPHPETLSDKAAHAYEATRDKAYDAARTTAETLEGNPLGMLVGGIALGALVAAVLPRSQRERDLLAPAGRRLAAALTAAIAAAKEAGRGELEQLNLTPDAAKEKARSLLDGLGKAASTAGSAAAKAGREHVSAG